MLLSRLRTEHIRLCVNIFEVTVSLVHKKYPNRYDFKKTIDKKALLDRTFLVLFFTIFPFVLFSNSALSYYNGIIKHLCRVVQCCSLYIRMVGARADHMRCPLYVFHHPIPKIYKKVADFFSSKN